MRRSLFILACLALLGATCVFQHPAAQDVRRRPVHGSATPTPTPDFVTDTFTEGSDVLLGAHTGELGATWTVHPSYGNVMNLTASLDRIWPTSNPSAFTASGTPPSANYTVCADVFAVTDIAANIGPCGRMDTSANTMYCARYNSGTSWDLRKVLAGTQSTLDTSTSQLISTGTSKRLCLIMNGTTISMTVQGVEEGSVTDTDITAAGKAGVRSSGGASSTTGYHLDNFSAQ